MSSEYTSKSREAYKKEKNPRSPEKKMRADLTRAPPRPQNAPTLYDDHQGQEFDFHDNLIAFMENERQKYLQSTEIERYFLESIEFDINMIAKRNEENLRPYAPHRQILVSTISQIVDEMFNKTEEKTVKLEMFGSMAQGLAIETSDMDMVITGLNCDANKEVEKQHLLQISKQIKEKFSTDLLIEVEEIVSTDFPVLKLTFSTDKIGKLYQIPMFYSEEKINHIYMDITIQDEDGEEHFGSQCREFVRQTIANNPCLKPVCIILKKILRRYDLNKPYTGGLGSYSLFVMLLAVYNESQKSFLSPLSASHHT